MRKIFFIISLFLIVINFLLTSAYAQSVEMKLKDYECLENGEVRIRYGLINNKNFDIHNVILGFKIIVDDKLVACKEINVTVQKNSDGSDIQEIFIQASCEPHTFKVGYVAFYLTKRYKIDDWFSGCP